MRHINDSVEALYPMPDRDIWMPSPWRFVVSSMGQFSTYKSWTDLGHIICDDLFKDFTFSEGDGNATPRVVAEYVARLEALLTRLDAADTRALRALMNRTRG